MSLKTRVAVGTLPLLAAIAAPISSAQASDGAVSPVPPAPSVVAGGASVTEPGPLVKVIGRRLSSTTSFVWVRGRANATVHAELRVIGEQRPLAERDVPAGERFRLRGRADHGDRLQLVTTRTDGVRTHQTRTLGTARQLKLRSALASWYGPGLFGNKTACGPRLTSSLKGVAHRTLACGTKLTISYRGRTTQARVVDRGPFHGNREFDLTAATARALRFDGVGTIRVSR